MWGAIEKRARLFARENCPPISHVSSKVRTFFFMPRSHLQVHLSRNSHAGKNERDVDPVTATTRLRNSHIPPDSSQTLSHVAFTCTGMTGSVKGGGGTHVYWQYRYVRPLRPPFHALPAVPKHIFFIARRSKAYLFH